MNDYNSKNDSRPQLARWQYSLRALFVTLLICGIASGIIITSFRGKESTIARLYALGASVSFDYQWSELGAWRPNEGPPGNSIFRFLLGKHYAANPVEVQLFAEASMKPKDFGDQDAVALASLSTIKWLVLQDSSLTDAGLLHLAAISSLERLDLEGSPVTPDGVEVFRRIRPDVKIYY